MLKGIKILNFQSCKNVEIKNLADVTLLMGVNNTGKSAILKAMNFPVESFITGNPQQWNKVTAYSPNLHSYRETVYEKNINNNIDISYVIKPTNELLRLLNTLKEHDDYGIIDIEEITLNIKYDSDNNINDGIYDKNGVLIYEKQGRDIYLSDKKTQMRLDSSNQNWDMEKKDTLSLLINDIHNEIRGFFKKIHFFSVDRRPQNWIAQPKKWDRLGIHGENVVSLFNYLKNSDEEGFERICELILQISPDIVKIRTPMTEEGDVSISHKVHGLQVDVNTLMSGTGINQAIPLIVQLIYSREGDIILIEEPELSLYPEAQEVIANLILTEAKKGIKIICTTHSDTIPFRFWLATKKKEISTKYVCTYIVNKVSGETKITKKNLEESLNIIFAPKDYKPM